jgi:uncharacterized protein with NAD-binding domain and iron-sulfur cluster
VVADQRWAVSRRTFLQGAAASAALVAGRRVLPIGPAGAQGAARGPRVAILGGGVAGLSAAHELAERGFDVVVYDRHGVFGGKARSVPVPGSAGGGRAELPGEHGFRFFPGFYKNLGDTLRRIPAGGGTAYDHLVRASTYLHSRAGGRADMTLMLSAPPELTVESFVESLAAGYEAMFRLPPGEAMYFANRMAVYTTSCDDRRLGQWERVAWSEFTRAKEMSEEYRRAFNRGLTRNLAAMRSEDASTHSIGLIGEATILSAMGRGNDGDATVDRVLDGPTSEAWLEPWVSHLQGLGVRFQSGWTVEALQLVGGRVVSATAGTAAGQTAVISADWFVCCMPVERAAKLLSAEVLAAAPELASIPRLRTDWMNGVMFYLRRPTPITHGHVSYIDSPWALTSISQAQFWARDFEAAYGDGDSAECLSTIISDWVTPGIVFGKPARDCRPEEIAVEVWEQMKAHLNDRGRSVLSDDLLVRWFVDPGIIGSGTPEVANDEPLFIQHTGSWYDRPEAATSIPNLFLAADYVRTYINVTTMEGANEAARRAVNGLLDAAGSHEPRAPVWDLYHASEFEAWKALDRERWRRHEPNVFDGYPAVVRPGGPGPLRGTGGSPPPGTGGVRPASAPPKSSRPAPSG